MSRLSLRHRTSQYVYQSRVSCIITSVNTSACLPVTRLVCLYVCEYTSLSTNHRFRLSLRVLSRQSVNRSHVCHYVCDHTRLSTSNMLLITSCQSVTNLCLFFGNVCLFRDVGVGEEERDDVEADNTGDLRGFIPRKGERRH